jgi:hypothetical protein
MFIWKAEFNIDSRGVKETILAVLQPSKVFS